MIKYIKLLKSLAHTTMASRISNESFTGVDFFDTDNDVNWTDDDDVNCTDDDVNWTGALHGPVILPSGESSRPVLVPLTGGTKNTSTTAAKTAADTDAKVQSPSNPWDITAKQPKIPEDIQGEHTHECPHGEHTHECRRDEDTHTVTKSVVGATLAMVRVLKFLSLVSKDTTLRHLLPMLHLSIEIDSGVGQKCRHGAKCFRQHKKGSARCRFVHPKVLDIYLEFLDDDTVRLWITERSSVSHCEAVKALNKWWTTFFNKSNKDLKKKHTPCYKALDWLRNNFDKLGTNTGIQKAFLVTMWPQMIDSEEVMKVGSLANSGQAYKDLVKLFKTTDRWNEVCEATKSHIGHLMWHLKDDQHKRTFETGPKMSTHCFTLDQATEWAQAYHCAGKDKMAELIRSKLSRAVEEIMHRYRLYPCQKRIVSAAFRRSHFGRGVCRQKHLTGGDLNDLIVKFYLTKETMEINLPERSLKNIRKLYEG